MRRDGQTRRESWLLLLIGGALAFVAMFLALTREHVDTTLLVTLLSFACVFCAVPLPDILRPRGGSGTDEEEPK